nr:BRI3-binding protein [Syngnathus scovelli]
MDGFRGYFTASRHSQEHALRGSAAGKARDLIITTLPSIFNIITFRRAMKASTSVLLFLVLSASVLSTAQAARSRTSSQNSFRRAANGIYQTLSNVFGEDNIRCLYKFFSKATERFVHGVDSFLDTIWKIWTDLLDVMGIDSSNLSHYFSPASLSSNPARALPLVAGALTALWLLSVFLGGVFYMLHVVFGRFFWMARVLLLTLSCLYVLQKFEGDPERTLLPLCVIMVLYFMTGPVGMYWRRGTSSMEEKIDHMDTQLRLLNMRMNRIFELETMDE